jgi:tetratricopeptide (TPR) repeat protein
LTLPLATLLSGCFTTGSQKNAGTRIEEAPKVVRKEDGPKRNPHASTEIAFGKLKEAEADSDEAKSQPEAQARLRDDARKAYQHALKLEPTNLEASRRLGQLYAKIGDYERAQDIYKKVMAKHPKDATLWYDLAMCHKRRHDFNESARCLNKALELDPENREYQKKLGFTLAWMGQYDQGLTWLTRAQGAGEAHLNVARVLGLKDQIELAKHHLRLAKTANGELLPEARDLLAALDNPATTALRRGDLE